MKKKTKSNTLIHLAFINQSFSPDTLETFDLDYLLMNALSRSPYVPYNPSMNLIAYFIKPQLP